MNTGVLPTSVPVNMAGNLVSSVLGGTSGGTLPTLTKLSPKTEGTRFVALKGFKNVSIRFSEGAA